MTGLNQQPPTQTVKANFFVLGFRPFFLAAGIFSVVSMLSWLAVYVFYVQIPLLGLASHYWHAHEMIYGFAMAAVAGFLLTAVKNWTGVQTVQNTPLLILVLMWFGARISMLLGVDFFTAAAIFDLSFSVCLFVAVLLPILKVKQWRQAGIVSKIFLLAVCNMLFYLGLFGVLEKGVYWGLYGGLFLILALVLTIARRVMPFFIEKGVDYNVQLKNSTFLDSSNLFIFLAFALAEVFVQDARISSYLSTLLFVISCVRLYNWHTIGIWKKPLLWGLYSSFIFITLGFLLFALQPYVNLISRSLALHAFTVGGFGLIILSMMSRVTLGHTGRSVKQPSRWVSMAQWLILAAVICRVFLPLVLEGLYVESVFISQLLWIMGFALFVLVNYPYLTQSRVDGAEG